MTCSSSRTLPFQGWERRRSRTPAERLRGRLLVAGGELLQEVVAEERDVVGALAQGRDADDDRVDAVEEVLAEGAGGDAGLEVLVGRGDQAEVHRGRPAAADALDFVGLEDAQELGLDGRRQRPDLVQEHRSLVRQLEAAGPRSHGAGEGALLVAEELRLRERLGEGRGVDRDEEMVAAGAPLVDRVGHELLARPALPLEHHRGVGRGDLLDVGEEPLHAGSRADQLVEPVLLAGLLLELAVLVQQTPALERAAQDDEELGGVHGLAEEVEGSELDRARAGLAVLLARTSSRRSRRGRGGGFRSGGTGPPRSCRRGQAQVEEVEVRFLASRARPAGPPRRG